MSNLIHDFPLNSIGGYTFTRKSVRLDGYETDIVQLKALEEMFARAAYNVIYKQRPSGPSYVLDLTADQRNLKYCTFDTEELIDGWYALQNFSYSPRQGRINHFPYRMTLLWVGTNAGYQQWYQTQNFEEVANDWGI